MDWKSSRMVSFLLGFIEIIHILLSVIENNGNLLFFLVLLIIEVLATENDKWRIGYG